VCKTAVCWPLQHCELLTFSGSSCCCCCCCCSEWETRSLYAYMQRELAGSARLSSMFMDVHSGMWALMSPW
jgi:hypothetical protein